jgi:hypothetical protein
MMRAVAPLDAAEKYCQIKPLINVCLLFPTEESTLVFLLARNKSFGALWGKIYCWIGKISESKPNNAEPHT